MIRKVVADTLLLQRGIQSARDLKVDLGWRRLIVPAAIRVELAAFSADFQRTHFQAEVGCMGLVERRDAATDVLREVVRPQAIRVFDFDIPVDFLSSRVLALFSQTPQLGAFTRNGKMILSSYRESRRLDRELELKATDWTKAARFLRACTHGKWPENFVELQRLLQAHDPDHPWLLCLGTEMFCFPNAVVSTDCYIERVQRRADQTGWTAAFDTHNHSWSPEEIIQIPRGGYDPSLRRLLRFSPNDFFSNLRKGVEWMEIRNIDPFMRTLDTIEIASRFYRVPDIRERYKKLLDMVYALARGEQHYWNPQRYSVFSNQVRTEAQTWLALNWPLHSMLIAAYLQSEGIMVHAPEGSYCSFEKPQQLRNGLELILHYLWKAEASGAFPEIPAEVFAAHEEARLQMRVSTLEQYQHQPAGRMPADALELLASELPRIRSVGASLDPEEIRATGARARELEERMHAAYERP